MSGTKKSTGSKSKGQGQASTKGAAQVKGTPSSVGSFKRAAKGGIVELPSGNKVRIRPADMQTFLRKGMIPDSLTPIVQEALDNGKKGKKTDGQTIAEKAGEIVQDPEEMNRVLQLFDDVVMFCWTEPQVHPAPESNDEREDDLLYTDEIGFDDKSFTFQFAVGGVRDLESFRSQQETVLAGVPSSADVEHETE